MQANLYATFRLIANIKTISLALPAGSSVMQAINTIICQFPILKNHWLDEKGELHAHVHVFINGLDIANMPAGLNTPLQSEDVLDFFPPVAGG